MHNGVFMASTAVRAAQKTAEYVRRQTETPIRHGEGDTCDMAVRCRSSDAFFCAALCMGGSDFDCPHFIRSVRTSDADLQTGP